MPFFPASPHGLSSRTKSSEKDSSSLHESNKLCVSSPCVTCELSCKTDSLSCHDLRELPSSLLSWLFFLFPQQCLSEKTMKGMRGQTEVEAKTLWSETCLRISFSSFDSFFHHQVNYQIIYIMLSHKMRHINWVMTLAIKRETKWKKKERVTRVTLSRKRLKQWDFPFNR